MATTYLFSDNSRFLVVREFNTIYFVARRTKEGSKYRIILYLVGKSRVDPRNGEILGDRSIHPMSCINWKLGLTSTEIKFILDELNGGKAIISQVS